MALFYGLFAERKMKTLTSQLIFDFLQAAKLAGLKVTDQDISYEILPAPHRPPIHLPAGKFGVYVFLYKEQCLKVGKVGPKSKARYTSQHYSPDSSNSNLAKSILANPPNLGLEHLDKTTVGDWIKRETHRINFLLDSSVGISTLTFLEIFIQCRLNPKYEGFDSQK
jgi:hypothetical protein